MSQKDQLQDRTESLTDLPLTVEQAELTKAGGPFFAYDNNFRGGVYVASGD